MICLLTSCLLASLAHAQRDNTDIDIVQSIFGRNKRMIIDANLKLDDQDKSRFWNIYDQYEEKRKSIERERFLLLKDYADSYESLDAAKAGRLMTGFMKTTDEYNKLYKTYFKKVEKAVGGLKAATFIQMETFIQTALQSNLQSQVPIIGELERINNQKAGQTLGILKE
jgi:hypothetical protein